MLEVNQTLTAAQCAEVPVGSIVEGATLKAVRTYTGWMDTGRRIYPAKYLPQYVPHARLTVIADQPKQTLEHFKQRLRTIAIGRARASGVNIEPVHRILNGCNVPTYQPSVGMWVDFSDNEIRFPENTVAQVGTPDVWELYCMWVYRGSGWRWLTGGYVEAEGATVIDLPGGGVEDWYSTPWTEADDQLIEDLKREVLRLGAIAKRTASWCGQYELALERLCIGTELPTGDEEEAEDWEEDTQAPMPAPPNQWLDANRGAFRVGDRVTRRNRPHTLRGGGDYREADIGVVGTIRSDRSDGYTGQPQFGGQWGVNWDTGRSSTIDGECIMLAEQEFTVGAHVARAYAQTLVYDGFACDFQAEPGDIGEVTNSNGNYATVRWSNGHRNSYSTSCLEVVRPPEGTVEPEVNTFDVGDRVCLSDRYWITNPDEDHRSYGYLAAAGSVGAVTQLETFRGHRCAMVRWDHSNGVTRVNIAALEHESQPEPETARAPQEGDLVRLVSRFAWRGDSRDDWDQRFGVIGDVGRVVDVGPDVVRVTWPNGSDPDFRSNVDPACVVVHRPREPRVGDRVRRLSNTYSIADMRRYNPQWERYCSPGDVGEVIEASVTGILRVRWDNDSVDEGARTRGRRIDAHCVEVVQ